MWIKFVVAVAAAVVLLSADVRDVFRAIEQGKKLTPGQVAELEQKLARSQDDTEARTKLLSWYTFSADPEQARPARLRHIRWFIDHRPDAELFGTYPPIHLITRAGEPLSDPEAADELTAVWLRLVKSKPDDARLRQRAVSQMMQADAAKVHRQYGSMLTASESGSLYANAVLGIIGQDPRTGEPLVSAEGANSDFATRARAVLEESTNPELLAAAAKTLANSGDRLYAAGRTDIDHSRVLKPLLARARELAPNDLLLLPLSGELPARGAFIPSVIRVGGQVQADKLVRQPPPSYPPDALARAVEGTVRMSVLLNPEGKVAGVEVVSGPRELLAAAVASVRQWEYKPTSLNGRPVYVLTTVDVNFRLSR